MLLSGVYRDLNSVPKRGLSKRRAKCYGFLHVHVYDSWKVGSRRAFHVVLAESPVRGTPSLLPFTDKRTISEPSSWDRHHPSPPANICEARDSLVSVGTVKNGRLVAVVKAKLEEPIRRAVSTKPAQSLRGSREGIVLMLWPPGDRRRANPPRIGLRSARRVIQNP